MGEDGPGRPVAVGAVLNRRTPDEPGHEAGSFFGRRKGKRLRVGQEALLADLLPRIRVSRPAVAGETGLLDPRLLFPGSATPVRLEIGFGGGEHLASTARNDPGAGFIGGEPFVNGVAKLLATIDREGLGNIRIWDGDAADLLPTLSDASIAAAYLLFPDPWPKRRQRKRRFVSDENLRQLARVLKPGAEFRFATDIDDYAGWTLARILRSPDFDWRPVRADDWRRPWPDWPGTRYEAKARSQGRSSCYLTFIRT